MSDRFRSIAQRASNEWLLRQLQSRIKRKKSDHLITEEIVAEEIEQAGIILSEIEHRMNGHQK